MRHGDPRSDLQVKDIWLQEIENETDKRVFMDDDLLVESINHVNKTLLKLLQRVKNLEEIHEIKESDW